MYCIRQRSFRRLSDLLSWSFCALFLLGALGCGTGSRSLFGGDIAVRVDADAKINQDSPVPVELVIVYDKDLVEKLAGVKARDWFAGREQFRKDHPGTTSHFSLPSTGVVRRHTRRNGAIRDCASATSRS